MHKDERKIKIHFKLYFQIKIADVNKNYSFHFYVRMCCSQNNVSIFVINILKWSQHLVNRITIKKMINYQVCNCLFQFLSTRKWSVNSIGIDKDFSNVNYRSIYIHHTTKLCYSSEIILWHYMKAIRNVNSKHLELDRF